MNPTEHADDRRDDEPATTMEEEQEGDDEDALTLVDGVRMLRHTCTQCRRSKVRCDRLFPCSRCVRLDLDCSSQRRGPGRPLKFHQKSRTTMLLDHAATTPAPGQGSPDQQQLQLQAARPRRAEPVMRKRKDAGVPRPAPPVPKAKRPAPAIPVKREEGQQHHHPSQEEEQRRWRQRQQQQRAPRQQDEPQGEEEEEEEDFDSYEPYYPSTTRLGPPTITTRITPTTTSGVIPKVGGVGLRREGARPHLEEEEEEEEEEEDHHNHHHMPLDADEDAIRQAVVLGRCIADMQDDGQLDLDKGTRLMKSLVRYRREQGSDGTCGLLDDLKRAVGDKGQRLGGVPPAMAHEHDDDEEVEKGGDWEGRDNVTSLDMIGCLPWELKDMDDTCSAISGYIMKGGKCRWFNNQRWAHYFSTQHEASHRLQGGDAILPWYLMFEVINTVDQRKFFRQLMYYMTGKNGGLQEMAMVVKCRDKWSVDFPALVRVRYVDETGDGSFTAMSMSVLPLPSSRQAGHGGYGGVEAEDKQCVEGASKRSRRGGSDDLLELSNAAMLLSRVPKEAPPPPPAITTTTREAPPPSHIMVPTPLEPSPRTSPATPPQPVLLPPFQPHPPSTNTSILPPPLAPPPSTALALPPPSHPYMGMGHFKQQPPSWPPTTHEDNCFIPTHNPDHHLTHYPRAHMQPTIMAANGFVPAVVYGNGGATRSSRNW